MSEGAEWYCHECETFGGGSPNHMTMQEHIDFAHYGGIVQMESTPL
jgi:hypothetical protein